jgi:hypothetical protein
MQRLRPGRFFLLFPVTIIDDRLKLQGKSYAKQAGQCFTIVCIAVRAQAVTLIGRTVHAVCFATVLQRTSQESIMNILQFIRDKIQAREDKDVSGVQDLVLYRELRRTESKLFEARESLGRTLALQKQAVAEHARLAQVCDEPGQPFSAVNKGPTPDCGSEQHSAVPPQQDMSPRMEELQKKIALLKSDIHRLETEYQQVQMNVRTYFYLETCSGRLPEGGVTAGQPAQ